MIKPPVKLLRDLMTGARPMEATRSVTARAFLKQTLSTPELIRGRLQLSKRKSPRVAYVVAMTPRSGSSYLCDLMTATGRFGTPGEYLNAEFLPALLQSFPAANPAEYLSHMLKAKMGRNGVSGFKASWFQFANFIALLDDEQCLEGLRFISLRRIDTVAQAVSLYIATSTRVFHTNVAHSQERLEAVKNLEYSHSAIAEWHKHILVQEAGWDAFFAAHGISPLKVRYEEVERQPEGVLRRMAGHLDVRRIAVQMPPEGSVFRKLADERNTSWAQRFRAESDPPEAAASPPESDARKPVTLSETR